MITYRTDKDDLNGLYSDAGWTSYTKDLPKLQQAVANSWYVITAWEGAELVGLIRAISDGLTIAYIQDILVRNRCQSQGIGSQLMRRMLTEVSHIRQVVLITDDDEWNKGTLSWYEARGFTPFPKMKVAGFYKDNSAPANEPTQPS